MDDAKDIFAIEMARKEAIGLRLTSNEMPRCKRSRYF